MNWQMLIEYMPETYPALDPARVYVMGYSKGGSITLQAIAGNPGILAAAVPMAAPDYEPNAEEAARFDTVDLPVMFTTSSYDLPVDQPTGNIGPSYQVMLNRLFGFDGLPIIEEFNYDKYPTSGFHADTVTTITLNNEYKNTPGS